MSRLTLIALFVAMAGCSTHNPIEVCKHIQEVILAENPKADTAQARERKAKGMAYCIDQFQLTVKMAEATDRRDLTDRMFKCIMRADSYAVIDVCLRLE
jgi:hypothetical protein